MDQEGMSVCIEARKNSCQVVEGNPKSSVHGVVSETVKNSREKLCFSEQNSDLRLQINSFGSCIGNRHSGVNGVVSEIISLKSSKQNLDSKVQTNSFGSCIENGHPEVNGIVSETIILKSPKQNLDSRVQTNGFGSCIGNGYPEVNGVVSETIILKSSKQNSDSILQTKGFGSCIRNDHPEVNGVVSETIIPKSSKQNSDSRVQTNGFGSCIGNGHLEVNGVVSETIILKNSKQNSDSKVQTNGFESCIENGHPEVNGVASETTIPKSSKQNSDSILQTNGFGSCIENGHPEVNGIVSDGIVSESIILKSSKQNSDSRLQTNGFGSCIGNGHPEVNGVISETIILKSSKQNSNSILPRVISSEGLVEASMQLINKDSNEKSGVGDTMDHVDQRSSESSCDTLDGFASESTVIVIKTLEEACVDGSNVVLEAKDSGYDSCKVLTERPKTKVVVEADMCLIDIKGTSGVRRQFKEHLDGESLCRICHLSSEHVVHSSTTAVTTTELIQIGCGCKDELGIAHGQCAEAWFKLKGNRLCEICGQTAENVTGVGDSGFIENWYHQGSTTVGVSLSDQGRSPWRGKPYCNFFMGCLVIAFVLPWLFHVHMF